MERERERPKQADQRNGRQQSGVEWQYSTVQYSAAQYEGTANDRKGVRACRTNLHYHTHTLHRCLHNLDLAAQQSHAAPASVLSYKLASATTSLSSPSHRHNKRMTHRSR